MSTPSTKTVVVSRRGVTLPVLAVANEPALVAGTVYIHDGQAKYEDGQELVLEVLEPTQDGGQNMRRLEVKTVTVRGSPLPSGYTYLCAADKVGLGEERPKARRYSLRDRLRKARSAAGSLLYLSAATGFIGAGVTLLAVLMPVPPTLLDPDRVDAALSWTVEPMTEMPVPQGSGQLSIADAHEFESRWFQTQWCLQSLQGRQEPPAQIPHVDCAHLRPSFLQENAAKISGLTAFIGALCTSSVAFRRSGFQQSP